MSKRGKLVKEVKVAAKAMISAITKISRLPEEDMQWAIKKLKEFELKEFELKEANPILDKLASKQADDLPF